METTLNEITVPNVSISETVKAFKTAFKFLEQNNLQAGYDELRTFKSLKKRWHYIISNIQHKRILLVFSTNND